MQHEATFNTKTEANSFAADVIADGGEVVTVDFDYTDEHSPSGRSTLYWFVIYIVNESTEE